MGGMMMAPKKPMAKKSPSAMASKKPAM
jgi:hypothetical protein